MLNLIEIQHELKTPKTRTNNFAGYKFRNCEDILEAVKPLLHKYGAFITVTDEVKELCGTLFIEATATIKTDKEAISVKAQAGIDLNKKGMDKAQTFGTASSYARKYALSGLLLIDDGADSDQINDHKEKPKAKPALPEERFEKALEAVRTGDYSPEALKDKYELSETQLTRLNELL